MRLLLHSVSTLLLLAAATSAQGLGASPGNQASPGQAAIEKAASAKKFALVLFWKERGAQTDKAWGDLQSAARTANWAEITAVQATDPAERQLVARYDLSRAPMPLVLAIAPCGAVTKAITGSITEAQVQSAYVSPCTQLCLKAIQDRKLVMLCVMDRKDPYRPAGVPQGVQDFKADGRYGPATEVVLVNATDQAEAAFLQDLQVDPREPKPVTVLLAPPGAMVGKFDSRATKEQMVAQLTAAQSNPCAGGKCGPNGCGPKK
ncbi:MAG: hypothetical protein ACYC6Y_23770 [Thermoguttaceae bacterium]